MWTPVESILFREVSSIQGTKFASLSLSFLQTRRLVSDFGMLVAITTMVVVAYLLRNLITVETLLVPPNYSVSNSTARTWIVNPFDGSLSIGAGFGAVIPAFLVRMVIAILQGSVVIL